MGQRRKLKIARIASLYKNINHKMIFFGQIFYFFQENKFCFQINTLVSVTYPKSKRFF